MGVNLLGLPDLSTWEARKGVALAALKLDLAWALELESSDVWNVTMLQGPVAQRRLLQNALPFLAVLLTGESQEALDQRLVGKRLEVLSSVFGTSLSATTLSINAVREVVISVLCAVSCNVSFGDTTVLIRDASETSSATISFKDHDDRTQQQERASAIVRVALDPPQGKVRVRLAKRSFVSLAACSGDHISSAVLKCSAFNSSTGDFSSIGCQGIETSSFTDCFCSDMFTVIALLYPAHVKFVSVAPKYVSIGDPATVYLLVLLGVFICLFARACHVDRRQAHLEIKKKPCDYLISAMKRHSWISMLTKQNGVSAVDHVFSVLTATLFNMVCLAVFFTNDSRVRTFLVEYAGTHSFTRAVVAIVVGCLVLALCLHELLLFAFNKTNKSKNAELPITTDNADDMHKWAWQCRYVLYLFCIVSWALMSWQILLLGTSFDFNPVFVCFTPLQRGWGSVWALLALISLLLSAPIAPLPFLFICAKALFDWLRAATKNKFMGRPEQPPRPDYPIEFDSKPTWDKEGPNTDLRTIFTISMFDKTRTHSLSSYFPSNITRADDQPLDDMSLVGRRSILPPTATVEQVEQELTEIEHSDDEKHDKTGVEDKGDSRTCLTLTTMLDKRNSISRATITEIEHSDDNMQVDANEGDESDGSEEDTYNRSRQSTSQCQGQSPEKQPSFRWGDRSIEGHIQTHARSGQHISASYIPPIVYTARFQSGSDSDSETVIRRDDDLDM